MSYSSFCLRALRMFWLSHSHQHSHQQFPPTGYIASIENHLKISHHLGLWAPFCFYGDFFWGMCVGGHYVYFNRLIVYISWVYQAYLWSTEKLFLAVLFSKETLQFSFKVIEIYYSFLPCVLARDHV